jgi:hypothetical protein
LAVEWKLEAVALLKERVEMEIALWERAQVDWVN